MQETYAIIWVAKHRDGAGIGTKRFSQAEAELVAASLNRDHPDFLHKTVDTATHDAMQALLLLKQSAVDFSTAAGGKVIADDFDRKAETVDSPDPSTSENRASVLVSFSE